MARTDRRPRRRMAPDKRRAAVLVAAAVAFGKAPYAQVSVSAIAEEAGMSEALVHRYFHGKAGLYAELIELAVNRLLQRQEAANLALDPHAPTRDRVKVALEVYLDHIAEEPTPWAAPFLVAGNDPPAVHALRRRVREEYVGRLATLLVADQGLRHHYALWGYFGFLDGACLSWAERGCPIHERHSLVEAALGALEGALSDWGH